MWSRRVTVWAVAAIAAVAVLHLLIAGWPARNYQNGDFFQYYAGASAVASGVSPYDKSWWADFSARQGSTALHDPPQPEVGEVGWTTPYPLYLFVAILPIALMPLELAAALWLVAEVFCILTGLVFLARRLFPDPRGDGLLLAGLTLGFQPIWLLEGFGNLSGLVFGALAGAIGMSLRGRPRAAGAFLAICAVKPQSLLIVAVVLVLTTPRRDRLRPFSGAALVGLPLLAAAFALQPAWVGGWLGAVAALQHTEFSNATGWTVHRSVPGGPVALSLIAVAAVVGVLGVWARRVRPTPAWAIAAAIPVSLFAAPHGWTYEQVFLLISAVVVIGGVADAEPRARAFILTILATALLPIPWVLHAWDHSRGGEEPSAAVPIVVLGVVLLAHRLSARAPRVQARDTNGRLHDDRRSMPIPTVD